MSRLNFIEGMYNISMASLKLYLSRIGIRFSPFSLVWYITWLCNSNCLACGWGKKYQDYQESIDNELRIERIREIIFEARESGCRHIAFSGGEPLLKKGIFNIISFARGLHIFTEISTNGFALDEHASECLVQTGVNNIHVSLDSADELHDRLRNVVNAFEKADKGIDLLMRQKEKGKFYLGINMVINRLNFRKISDVCNYARRKGLDGISMQIYHENQTRDIESVGDLKIGEEDIPELEDNILTVYNNYNNLIRNSKQYLLNIPKYCRNEVFVKKTCTAGQQQMYVFPFGEISPCCFLDRVDSLNENSFKDLVHSEEMDDLVEKAGRGQCPGCWSPGTHEFNSLMRISNISSMVKNAKNYLKYFS